VLQVYSVQTTLTKVSQKNIEKGLTTAPFLLYNKLKYKLVRINYG